MSHAHAVPPAPPIDVTTTAADTFEVTTVRTDANRAAVQAQGEMDLANADLLTEVLGSHLAAGRRFVRLDLSRLAFVDCAGLRVLVLAHNQFLTQRGTLILTGVGARIAHLLHTTHLDEALFVADGPGEPHRIRHLNPPPTEAAR